MLVTLLVLSPTFLALAIVLFALLGRVARHGAIRPALTDQPPHNGRLQ